MQQYFSGNVLYGDDFTPQEIEDWYKDEKEGYAGLIKSDPRAYHYGYHQVNNLHLFKFLPKKKFLNVLGLGSAYGHEFLPVAPLIENLYILEPSDALVNEDLPKNIHVIYKKPSTGGEMDFPDDFFDLVVCFDTLHHIPNVSQVFSEMARCLNPTGHLLVKEPVTSMGDWRLERPGLTKRERGIPYFYFERLIQKTGLITLHRSLFFTMTSFLTRKLQKMLPKAIYEYHAYLLADKFLSRLLEWHICYHPRNWWQRIAPSQVGYVLTKSSDG